jgi:hypothetical protein
MAKGFSVVWKISPLILIRHSPRHNLCCGRLPALSEKHHASPDHQCPTGMKSAAEADKEVIGDGGCMYNKSA